MTGFFSRLWRSKDEKEGLRQRQIQLDIFHEQGQKVRVEPQPVQAAPTPIISVDRLREETEQKIKVFLSNVKEMKDLSLKMEELAKLYRSGEISKGIFDVIRAEMGARLATLLEEQFNLREFLEVAKAKAKLEWAKEKIGLKEFEEKRRERYNPENAPHYPLLKWEKVINSIDEAFNSLTIDDEISFISQYLNTIREKGSSNNVKKGRAFCQQRLDEISKKWSTMRREKIEEIMNLELKASEVRDAIKETEARYAVGEFDENTYENKLGVLQGKLRSIETKIEEIRRYIDDIDMKIFRCLETLRESS
ncbi:hypothetical protein CW702_02075 [Candidatus Bathyarchaeota archaeon]|nr:MAG: hypothetical protein CW702_02075 [Candidatus Bathyarchaeota archaeon]